MDNSFDLNHVHCTNDGKSIFMHCNYYGGDGQLWHIVAENEKYLYAYKANEKEPSITKSGQKLKRLKPEWLSIEKPDDWASIKKDAMTLVHALDDVLTPRTRDEYYDLIWRIQEMLKKQNF